MRIKCCEYLQRALGWSCLIYYFAYTFRERKWMRRGKVLLWWQVPLYLSLWYEWSLHAYIYMHKEFSPNIQVSKTYVLSNLEQTVCTKRETIYSHIPIKPMIAFSLYVHSPLKQLHTVSWLLCPKGTRWLRLMLPDHPLFKHLYHA